MCIFYMTERVTKGQKIRLYTELLYADTNTYQPFHVMEGNIESYNKKHKILTIQLPKKTYEYPLEAFSPEEQSNIMEVSQSIQHTPIYLTNIQFHTESKINNIPNMRITKTEQIVGGGPRNKTKRKQSKKRNTKRRTALRSKKM